MAENYNNTTFEFQYEDVRGTMDILAVYTDLQESFRDKHEDFTKYYNYVVTKMQIPDEVKEQLLKDDRPTNAYNFVTKMVRALVSIENANRKKIIAQGITSEDNEMSWLITKVVQYFMDKGDFDFARTRAAVDAIIGGYGVVYNQWTYANDPLGDELYQPKDPRKIYFEPYYGDTKMEQSRYIIERMDLTIEEIIDKYAIDDDQLQKEILIKFWQRYGNYSRREKKKFLTTLVERFIQSMGETLAIDYESAISSEDREQHFRQWVNPTTGRFTVLEVHERRSERRVIVYLPEIDEEVDITEDVLNKDGFTFDENKIQEISQRLSEEYGARVFPKKEIRKVMYMSAWLPAFYLKLADAPYPHDNNNNFAYSFVFMNDFHADVLNSSGMVEEVTDLQDDFNKARNLELEFLARALSKGYMVEDGAIDGFEDEWNSREIGRVKRVNPGYWDKVKPEEDFNIPNEVFKVSQEIPIMMQEITGVTRALFGQTDSADESGRLFSYKRRQAEMSFAHFFDNLDRMTIQVAKNTLADIQYFCDEERVIRITTDVDKPEYLTINQRQLVVEQGQLIERILNDVTVGQYDIQISTRPYTSTAKELEYLKLMDTVGVIAQMQPELAPKLVPVIVSASDSPYRAEILRVIEEAQRQAEQDPITQLQMQLAQLELQLKQAEIQKTQAEAMDKQASAQQKASSGQFDIQGKQIDHRIKQIDYQMKVIELQKALAEVKAKMAELQMKSAANPYELMGNQFDIDKKKLEVQKLEIDNATRAAKFQNTLLDGKLKEKQLRSPLNPRG